MDEVKIYKRNKARETIILKATIRKILNHIVDDYDTKIKKQQCVIEEQKKLIRYLSSIKEKSSIPSSIGDAGKQPERIDSNPSTK